jgi:hypothetical protein
MTKAAVLDHDQTIMEEKASFPINKFLVRVIEFKIEPYLILVYQDQ